MKFAEDHPVISFILFWVGLYILGSIWSNFSGDDSSRTIHVDCSDPVRAEYDEFCNGDYEAQLQEENAMESDYNNSLRGY